MRNGAEKSQKWLRVPVNTVPGAEVGTAASVVKGKGKAALQLPQQHEVQSVHSAGCDECGVGKKIQSLQNHTGMCTLVCVKMKEWDSTELCTEQCSTAPLVPSHTRKVGPPVQGAVQECKDTLLWTLLCLNFSFSEKEARKEIKLWMWGKLLRRKHGHLCNEDGGQSYQAPTHSHVITSLWWHSGVTSKVGWGRSKTFHEKLQQERLQLLGCRGNPDSKWESHGGKFGNERRKKRLNPWNGLENGCVCYHKGWAPQLALSCGSGRECKLCSLQEGCERTRREGGEEEVQGSGQLVSARRCQKLVWK